MPNNNYKLDNVGTGGTYWYETPIMGPNEIQSITNPDKGISRDPNSIPSPFARLDLVKTAFENVNNNQADTLDIQLVSFTLDLIELLFNADLIPGISWNEWKTDDLEELKNSSLKAHKNLQKVFNLSLKDYPNLTSIQIIKYEYKVIGGTSPFTIFFTAADLPLIPWGNRNLFDTSNPVPLHQRSLEFQKYLHGSFRDFSIREKFSIFNSYLENELNNSSYRTEIIQYYNAQSNPNFNIDTDFPRYESPNGAILQSGPMIIRKKPKPDPSQSDFCIKPEHSVDGILPLVLPIQIDATNRSDWLYYGDTYYNQNFKAPYYDDQELSNRILPGLGQRGIYLTVSDFLTPYIIELPGKIDSQYFYDGGFGDDNRSYLLPLTETFLKYFPLSFCEGQYSDGKKHFEMIPTSHNAVKVIVRIPVKKQGINNNYISYERIYYPPSTAAAIDNSDEINNKGVIVKCEFSLALFPPFRIAEEGIKPDYRIHLVRDQAEREPSLNFLDNKNQSISEADSRSKYMSEEKDVTQSRLFALHKDFEYISVEITPGIKNILAIKWQTIKTGVDEFSFAVDFGTTNTHIEYYSGDELDETYSFEARDIVATLYRNTQETLTEADLQINLLTYLHEEDMLPTSLDGLFSFPNRTVSKVSPNFSTGILSTPLADISIPFLYGKKDMDFRGLNFNLKWEKNGDAKADDRLRSYLSILMLLMRTKVVSSGGKVSKTKLIWSYPASMPRSKVGSFKEIWRSLFETYFGSEEVENITESIAPYKFYTNEGDIAAGDDLVVTVDIGGGTSDVTVHANNQVQFISSFGFGGNALFGDGHSSTYDKKNGFVQKYKEYFDNLGSENDEIKVFIGKALGLKKSHEIINQFFSIAEFASVQDIKIVGIDFSDRLKQDKDFRILFLLYYVTILYYTANLIKYSGFKLPYAVLFSGMGSQIIDLIGDPRDTSGSLYKLTRLVFEEVINDKYTTDKPLKITKGDDPKDSKKVTAKGALHALEEGKLEAGAKDAIWVADDKNTITDLDSSIPYRQCKGENIKNNIETFIDFFTSLNKDINFKQQFDIHSSKLKLCTQILKQNIINNITTGINKRKTLNNEGDNDLISETPFFYHFIEVMRNLGHEIYKQSKVKPAPKTTDNINSQDNTGDSQTEYLYFTFPNEQGIFIADTQKEKTDSRILYKFTLSNSETAFFEVINQVDTIRSIISRTHIYLKPACAEQNLWDEHATEIITIKSGKVERQPNGDWKVIEKAQIEYKS